MGAVLYAAAAVYTCPTNFTGTLPSCITAPNHRSDFLLRSEPCQTDHEVTWKDHVMDGSQSHKVMAHRVNHIAL